MKTTNNNTKPFIVYQDGELDKTLSTLEPPRTPVTVLKSITSKLFDSINLQAEMAVYDALHGTNYRTIRNQLVREQRNKDFEARIGLVKKG